MSKKIWFAFVLLSKFCKYNLKSRAILETIQKSLFLRLVRVLTLSFHLFPCNFLDDQFDMISVLPQSVSKRSTMLHSHHIHANENCSLCCCSMFADPFSGNTGALVSETNLSSLEKFPTGANSKLATS